MKLTFSVHFNVNLHHKNFLNQYFMLRKNVFENLVTKG